MEEIAFKYFSGYISLEEEKILFEFISENESNLAQFRQWEELWAETAKNDEKITSEWKSLKAKIAIRESVRNEEPAKRIRFNFRKHIGTVAAVFVAALVSVFLLQQLLAFRTNSNFVQVEAAYGEKSKVTLADGTVVWLNSGSKLTYPETSKKKNYIVSLVGEGYFEVTKLKNRKFIVQTSAYNIEVVGTKFNVEAYPDDKLVTTSLLEGKINIERNNIRTSVEPGESVEFDKQTQKMVKAYTETETSNEWINNIITYDNITLNELIKKLSRQYNISIHLESEGLGERKFSVSLRNSETVTDVMRALEKILNVSIEQQNANYYIKKE